MIEANDVVPPYLYHYSGYGGLKGIVENKTIRFTRVNTLNDPVEGYITVNGENTIRIPMNCCYCSCWSSVSHESVAMWLNYADQGRGVRIKLSYDMFVPETGKMYICQFPNLRVRNCLYPATDIDAKMIGKDDGIYGRIDRVYGPAKVIYASESEVDDGTVKTLDYPINNENVFYVFPGRKILRKINHWDYEREYRYFLAPFPMITGPGFAMEKLERDVDWPEYIDIPIYKQIEEVVIGPKASFEQENDISRYLMAKGISNVYKSKVLLQQT